MSQEHEMVAVRLSKEKKKRWVDYVEESHQPTLSQLIRIATEREIARGNPLESPEQGDDDSREPSPEVMHNLEQISNKLQSIDRRLSAIESDRYGDEDLTELATEVYRILPSSITEIQQAVAQTEGAYPVEEDEADVEFMAEAMTDDSQEFTPLTSNTGQSSRGPCTGSVDNIAAILDADEEAVQLAITRLQSTTHSVYSVESAAGTVHYYKED
jgi:phenylpropionate dioxygenase-like ring-hydroxylating dioxygenase large terminal subunit